MRLAWLSPLPPIPSGIADYSAEILPLIAEEAQVHVYSPTAGLRGKVTVPRGIEVHPPRSFRRRADGYDAAFFHLGNNPHHEFVYRIATELPGVAVFHDFVLHHLIAHLFLIATSDWHTYRSLLVHEYGDVGETLARLRLYRMATGTENFLFPLNRHVARRARAIVVHGDAVGQEMSDVAPGVPIAVIPHHAGTPPPEVEGITRQAAREQLGLPGGAFLVGQFGFITAPKQPVAVLGGFARLLERRPDALLILVGQNLAPGLALESLIASMGLGGRVRVVGFVDLPGFYRYLNAVDVVVNLRYPSAGEASGTFARALAEGRAVVVSNVGSFAEVPRDVVLKVEVDGDQAEEVGRYLIRLAEDPAFKTSLEEGARRYAAAVLDPRRCAKLYLDVAWSVATSPASARR